MKYSNPVNLICSMSDTLSRSELLIGNYVIEHPSIVTSMTVRELASSTGTSPATVSRFARTLGYRSFSAMRTALAVGISGDSIPTENAKISFDSMQDSVSFMLKNKVAELQDTVALLDFDNVRQVVTVLKSADLVLFAAVGNTITTGMNAAFKFEQAGLRTNCPTSTEAMASAAINLTDCDALLVLTSSGYSKKLTGVFDCAEDANCPIVMVTDNPQTPLAQRANYVLRATVRDRVFTDNFSFSQNSMNFIIEMLFLFFISGWQESEETGRMLGKHLLPDRLY